MQGGAAAGGLAGDAAGIDPPPRRFFGLRDSTGNPCLPMKRSVLVGIFVALLVAIVLIAATWSKVTPVNPAVSPDTAATPNPTGQRK